MKNDYIKNLLTTLCNDQASDKYCISDEYLSMIKNRINDREQIMKQLNSFSEYSEAGTLNIK